MWLTTAAAIGLALPSVVSARVCAPYEDDLRVLMASSQPSEPFEEPRHLLKRQEQLPFNNDYSGPIYESPPSYPSPWGSGAGDWAAAYQRAAAFVSQLTLGKS